MKKIPAIAMLVTTAFSLSANADPLVLEAQDIMYAMSVDVGKPDGDAGKRTFAGIEEVLGSPVTNISTEVVDELYRTFVAKYLADAPVTWEYKSAEIEISGDNPAIFEGLKTLIKLKEAGINVVTFNFHCDNGFTIDEDAPENYPWERHLGCNLGYNILDGSSKEALKVYINEAKKLGLKVNLKPMFLGLASNKSIYGYSDGKVPIEEFFYGAEPRWDGYKDRIIRIATLAEAYGIEFLTIGTEFGNLNPDLMKAEDWIEIVAEIRKVYNGKLMYSHNLGGDGTLAELESIEPFIELIDILGVNFFPHLVLDGAKFFEVDEAANAFRSVKVDGKNLLRTLEEMSVRIDAKIVMSEVSFPTWRGNINWMFRHTCDSENIGKSGWEFSKGPLAPKEPSVAASLALAAAWYEAFADMPWIYGASHVFWHSTWVDDPRGIEFVKSIGLRECGKTLYENEHVRSIVASYYN